MLPAYSFNSTIPSSAVFYY